MELSENTEILIKVFQNNSIPNIIYGNMFYILFYKYSYE